MYYHGQEKTIGVRFYDLLDQKVDNRTGDEIALDVIKKANLVVKSEST